MGTNLALIKDVQKVVNNTNSMISNSLQTSLGMSMVHNNGLAKQNTSFENKKEESFPSKPVKKTIEPTIKVIKEESERSEQQSNRSFLFKNKKGSKSIQIDAKTDKKGIVSSERTIQMGSRPTFISDKFSDNKDKRFGKLFCFLSQEIRDFLFCCF